MNKQELVPSLEICEKLREVGYPQGESYFYWIETAMDLNGNNFEWIIGDIANYTNWGKQKISAPTFQEIIKRLPKEWYVEKSNAVDLYPENLLTYDRPAEKLAEKYIWLSENGYLEEK